MQRAASFHPGELWMFFAKDAAFRGARVKPHPLQFSYDGFLTVILKKLENCLYSRFESLSTIVQYFMRLQIIKYKQVKHCKER
jgi:hypothetical protein